MRAGFTITTEQGQMNVNVTLAEFLRWGQREGKPVASIADEAGIETWVELIHWAAVRTGQTDLDLNGFAATIVDIERQADVAPKATTTTRGKQSLSNSKS